MQHLTSLTQKRRINAVQVDMVQTPVKMPKVKAAGDVIPKPAKSKEISTEIGGPLTPSASQKRPSFLRRTLSSFSAASSDSPVRSMEMTEIRKNIFSSFRCVMQIADGMQYLHDNNINHRDLKSPNVLLDDDFSALIADFGESRIHIDPISLSAKQHRALNAFTGEDNRQSLGNRFSSSGSGGSSSGKGRMEAPTGTPGWAAPECIRELGSTKSSDVFSFGIIFWELLTWRPPSVFVTVADLRSSQLRSLPGVDELLSSHDAVYKKDMSATSNAAHSRDSTSVQITGQNPMHASKTKDENIPASQEGLDETKQHVLVEICDAARASILVCERGLRPPIPKDAPQWLHTLLSRCWYDDPQKRPKFDEIISILAATCEENMDITLPYDLS
jgi:serine/threonine protein kinase